MGTLVRRAVVVRIGALGDVLLTRRLTYSLSLEGFRSTLFAPGRHAALLASDPWIDGVLDSESSRLAGAFRGFWPEPDARYDLAVVISDSEEVARAAEGAARSIVRISPRPSLDDRPVSHQWAGALGSIGGAFEGDLPVLKAPGPGGSGAPMTFLHPGSGSPAKNWAADRFVGLGRTLAKAGHRIVWVKGPAEENFTAATPPFEALDKPPLQVLAATLAGARVVIGNDSGVSHLAASVGAPTVAIFGPTSDLLWRPDGPRIQTVRAGSGLLQDVRETDVLAAVRRLGVR